MGAIFRREIGAFFTSPIAYVFLAVFYLMTGLFFSLSSLASATTDMSAVFSMVFPILIVLIPIITMRLFSDEKRLKTEQALLTAPIRLFDMVLGKYLAALCLFAIGLSIFFVYALVLQFFGQVAWSFVLSNILALFFLGAAFISVGVFFSCLTESQVVAVILTLAMLIFVWLIDTVAAAVSKYKLLADVLFSLSVYKKYEEFTMGLFNLSSLVFMASMIFIFLFLTVRVFDKRRWG